MYSRENHTQLKLQNLKFKTVFCDILPDSILEIPAIDSGNN